MAIITPIGGQLVVRLSAADVAETYPPVRGLSIMRHPGGVLHHSGPFRFKDDIELQS